MIAAMFLAHLVGDYILQWNSLAAWKSKSLSGVAFHSLIVLVATWLFALFINPAWWPWVLFIAVLHFVIDASQLWVRLPVSPLARFMLDQLAHFVVILLALSVGGYLDLGQALATWQTGWQQEKALFYLLPFAFVTMPAWVVVKFTAYGLVKGTAPDFGGNSKYLGMMERILMMVFVALGQFYLVPLVILPRFALEWPEVARREDTAVYLAELLASVTLAVAAGLILRMI